MMMGMTPEQKRHELEAELENIELHVLSLPLSAPGEMADSEGQNVAVEQVDESGVKL